MTNIDFDHPDYFKNIDDVYDAFQHMALNVKKGIIAWGDDEYLRKLDVIFRFIIMALKKQMTSIKIFKLLKRVRNLMYILKANFMINSYPHNMEITTF